MEVKIRTKLCRQLFSRNKFIKDIVRVEKRMREFWDVHIDSINNIVYACPHYWGDTIVIYPRVEKKLN